MFSETPNSQRKASAIVLDINVPFLCCAIGQKYAGSTAFSRGDYNCALEYYQALSNNYGDVKVNETSLAKLFVRVVGCCCCITARKIVEQFKLQ